MMSAFTGVLRLEGDGESDYVLEENAESVWITVNDISVYVKRTDEGVAVDLYPLNDEASDPPLASTWALFSEALPESGEL